MNVKYATKDLSEEQMKKFLSYQKRKKMEAFQRALAEYRETIGEWELTDFQDAGPDWREVSTLKCDCGRTLRYQYTVVNRLTAEIHNFGIYHLQRHTGFTDNSIRSIQKYLNAVDREIEDVEQRLIENWDLNFLIPESLELPDELQITLDDGLPLSKKEEAKLIELVMEAQREELKNRRSQMNLDYEHKRQSVHQSGAMDSTYKVKRNGPFDLTEFEKVFVNALLASGIGSLMVITEELHSEGYYTERYLTGRSKLYPLCAFYLDQLVEEGKVVLLQKIGFIDRIYEVVVRG